MNPLIARAVRASRTKQAFDPLNPVDAGSQVRADQNAMFDAMLRHVRNLFLAGGAVGGGAKALQAMSSGGLWGNPAAEQTGALVRPRPIVRPVRVYGDPTKRRSQGDQDLLDVTTGPGASKMSSEAMLAGTFPYLSADTAKDHDMPHVLAGSMAPAGGAASVPWYGPAWGMAGAAGLYAGWKGVGAVTDYLRNSRRQADVSQAHGEFRKALDEVESEPAQLGEPYSDVVWQGRPRRVRVLPQPTGKTLDPSVYGSVVNPGKQASLASALNRLADLTMKTAQEPMSMPPNPAGPPEGPGLSGGPAGNYGGMLAGGYLGAAIPLSLLSGLAMYHHMRKQDPSVLLTKALKNRARARWLDRPPEAYVVPSPAGGRLAMNEPEDIAGA